MSLIFPWNIVSARSTGITGSFVTGPGILTGTEIDNATARDTYLALELLIVANDTDYPPSIGDRFDIYIIYATDGTNYESSTDPALLSKSPDATIVYAASGISTRKQTFVSIPIGPFKFKLVVKSVVYEEVHVTLKAYTYCEQAALNT
jgi:hypothetical protein